MTPAELLAVPLDRPGDVFPFDADEAKKLHRKLRSAMHPDHGGTDAALAHLDKLYGVAQVESSNGVYKRKHAVFVRSMETGKEYSMAVTKDFPFELGHTFIGKSFVVYAVLEQYKDLFDLAVAIITKELKYKDEAMRREAQRYMPTIAQTINTVGYRVMVVNKSPGTVRLRDLLNYLGGKMEPKHVAWHISRLCNIATYLRIGAGVMHGDISLDTFFVDPADHTGQLLGGWWYAVPVNRKLRALPARTLSLDLIGSTPIGSSSITNNLVRATGRELLGDLHGSKLLGDKSIPPAMLLWLRTPAGEDALHQYDEWFNRVLPKAFGPRKFHRLDVTPDMVCGLS